MSVPNFTQRLSLIEQQTSKHTNTFCINNISEYSELFFSRCYLTKMNETIIPVMRLFYASFY